MRHRDRQWLLDSDFRELLSPETICLVEVDQRTGPGRCKKVVAYYQDMAYGNDTWANLSRPGMTGCPKDLQFSCTHCSPTLREGKTSKGSIKP
ncbi:hypothetical protein QBC33DRAFT_521529 [Phialemonium atrogriseum]|uniref:Uncharacterized protein n=1 Tax=Phialemonium atrogriseum TaxID=1093897 RepID=A0AAJ0FLS4_9PEZI|nr:uncharacterized protein QBC33DRAFT_521529 [Phialemonium atrogriseum]KAK1772527.1 hypothetical protein QBC33DRAFT_521529 [Phialemonium atrogriseum]